MIKLFVLLVLCPFVFIQDVPLKPSDEYELRIDYSFQARPATDKNKIEFNEEEFKRKTMAGQLPHLRIEVKPTKLNANELRYRVVNSRGDLMASGKKVSVESIIKINIGFIDDVKDKIAPNEYTVYFLDNSKNEVSRILMVIQEDGTFLVNGERRGKF
jgi:hypothetical protein